MKKDLMRTGKKVVEKNLVMTTGGNISFRRGNVVYIKAKGTSLSSKNKKDYVSIDLKTGKCKGGIPSSEKYMHIACYKVRSDIKAVLHLHPVFSTAVANSKIKPGAVSYELVALLGSEILKAKYKPSGSHELAKEISRLIKKANAVLMPNHGLVVVGKTLKEGLKRALAVERACQTLIFSRLLGLFNFLPKKEAKRIISLYRK